MATTPARPLFRGAGAAVLSLIALASLVPLATTWIADPPDGTCGAVYRPDIWTRDASCGDQMLLRSVGVGVLAAAAVDLVRISTGTRSASAWWRRWAATTVLIGAVLSFAASDTATAWQLDGVRPSLGEISPAP